MDQESFRQLLQTSKPADSTSASKSRGSLLTTVAKPKTIDASKTAFKPRKVKTADNGKYRDRAAERRVGEGNDYAHIEAVLEDFERQTKDAKSQAEIEEKRKYLGGDSEHSVLVKGLDFALLKQNKARESLASDALDDDSLEKAFREVVTDPSTSKPKKRTREDLIRELKEKRTTVEAGQQKSPEERPLEEVKQKGKFKPIGESSDGKKKKKKLEEKDGERKKKKRKVDADVQPGPEAEQKVSVQEKQPPAPSSSIAPSRTVIQEPPEPEPIDDDFEIFADAGEYDGLDLGDGEDEEDGGKGLDRQETERHDQSPAILPQKWIPSDDEAPSILEKTHIPPLPPVPPSKPGPSKPSNDHSDDDQVMEEEGRPMRLVPLASSALPDVKELLQMDRASNSYNKNKKRKEKKKAAGGANAGAPDPKAAEAKAERDYKRLKAYTDKKAS